MCRIPTRLFVLKGNGINFLVKGRQSWVWQQIFWRLLWEWRQEGPQSTASYLQPPRIYIYILKNNKISTAPDEFQRLLCSCVGLCFCDPVLREMDAAAPHRVSPPIPHVWAGQGEGLSQWDSPLLLLIPTIYIFIMQIIFKYTLLQSNWKIRIGVA